MHSLWNGFLCSSPKPAVELNLLTLTHSKFSTYFLLLCRRKEDTRSFKCHRKYGFLMAASVHPVAPFGLNWRLLRLQCYTLRNSLQWGSLFHHEWMPDCRKIYIYICICVCVGCLSVGCLRLQQRRNPTWHNKSSSCRVTVRASRPRNVNAKQLQRLIQTWLDGSK